MCWACATLPLMSADLLRILWYSTGNIIIRICVYVCTWCLGAIKFHLHFLQAKKAKEGPGDETTWVAYYS